MAKYYKLYIHDCDYCFDKMADFDYHNNNLDEETKRSGMTLIIRVNRSKKYKMPSFAYGNMQEHYRERCRSIKGFLKREKNND